MEINRLRRNLLNADIIFYHTGVAGATLMDGGSPFPRMGEGPGMGVWLGMGEGPGIGANM